MERRPSRFRRLVVTAAIVLALGALALVSWAFVAKRRADEARVSHANAVASLRAHARVARGDDASRDDRLAAGRRFVEGAGKVFDLEWKTSSTGAPYFIARGKLAPAHADPWALAIARSLDERLPEPSADVRAWMEQRSRDLRALAASTTSGPMPEWQQAPAWDVSREARLAEIAARHFEMLAALDARQGSHSDAEALLDAAWSLRAGVSRTRPSSLGDEVLLGALRCTRVSDAGEWVRRLESVDARAEESDDALHVAGARLEGAREAWMPRWIIPPASTVLRMPAEMTASMTSDMASDFASRLDALDRCDLPTKAIAPGWERDRRLAQWLPASASLEVARRLVATEEREISLRLTRGVLLGRAGRDPDDGCAFVVATTAADGRTTVRWTPEPHPLSDEIPNAPRQFTFER